MKFWLILRTIALLIVVSVASALFAQDFITFDLPNSTATIPTSINLKGQVAGSYVPTTPDQFGGLFAICQHGFVRDIDGSFSSIDALFLSEPFTVQVTAINLKGRAIGYVPYDVDSVFSFVRETDGTLTEIRVPQEFTFNSFSAFRIPNYIRGTDAIDINSLGQIIGVHADLREIGFLRQRDGTFVTFEVLPSGPLMRVPHTRPQSINDLGQIAGYADASSLTYHGFFRERDGTITTFDPSDSTGTYAVAINLLGQIAGSYTTADGLSHGFLRRRDGAIVTFDPPGSTGTQVKAINFLGQIVGFYVDSSGITHSFARQYDGRIDTFDAPGIGVTGTFAQDVNDLGQITGYYTDLTGTHGFVSVTKATF